MTREEAIYELQLCVDAWDKWMLPGCSSLDKHKEAIKMALAALRGPTREQVGVMISIHAPREGSDARPAASCSSARLFLSTLPVRGATESEQHAASYERKFLSTLPVRGATGGKRNDPQTV